MRFAYYFPGRWVPPSPQLMTGAAHVRLARAAEAVGFEAVALDEHPAPSDSWRQTGHDTLDPFVALGMVAGATTTIKLLTYVAVVPFRNPFLLAKAAATLDLCSDGRLLLGVGLGYQAPEFAALGADFVNRRRRFDEGLEVMKLAWTGEPVSYVGTDFRADCVTVQPRPVQLPYPPIWIGGNGRESLRRVAAGAQGWMSMPVNRTHAAQVQAPPLETVDDLRRFIRRLADYAEEAGRTDPIDVVHSLRDLPDDWAQHLDAVRDLEDAGVTWVVANGKGSTVAEATAFIHDYGERIIQAMASQ